MTTLYGQSVAAIDREARAVTLANGLRLSYAKLVLATGSQPIRLPKPGMDLPGVCAFRNLADIAAMREICGRPPAP